MLYIITEQRRQAGVGVNRTLTVTVCGLSIIADVHTVQGNLSKVATLWLGKCGLNREVA